MLSQEIFYAKYGEKLYGPLSQYLHNDADDDGGHWWPDWFHNLLQLMKVPPDLYTKEYDEELEDSLDSAPPEASGEYIWYTVLYNLGYRTPADITFKEL